MPVQYGIDPLSVGENRTRSFGFMDTTISLDNLVTARPCLDPTNYSMLTPDTSLRNSLVVDVASRMFQHSPSNRKHNGQLDMAFLLF